MLIDNCPSVWYDVGMNTPTRGNRAAQKAWNARNRDKLNAYHRAYNQRPEVKAKVKKRLATPESRLKRLEYERTYREKNRAKLNAKALAWRNAHRETQNASSLAWSRRPEVRERRKQRLAEPVAKAKTNAAHRAWKQRNRERENATRKARYQRLRAEALATYGDKCAYCGETHPHFLSIDHKNGGGKRDRIALGCREGGVNWYKYLLDKHPDHVQILCHNCNMAKGHYGVCPHQILKET